MAIAPRIKVIDIIANLLRKEGYEVVASFRDTLYIYYPISEFYATLVVQEHLTLIVNEYYIWPHNKWLTINASDPHSIETILRILRNITISHYITFCCMIFMILFFFMVFSILLNIWHRHQAY